MTATTLNRAFERMGFNGKDSIGFSAHGFRANSFDNAERDGLSRRCYRASVGACREKQGARKLKPGRISGRATSDDAGMG